MTATLNAALRELKAHTTPTIATAIDKHTYAVSTKNKLLCLVVYARELWQETDVPICITVAPEKTLTKNQTAVAAMMMGALFERHRTATITNVDFAFQELFVEFKTWLDDLIKQNQTRGVRLLPRHLVFNKLLELESKQHEFKALAETAQRVKEHKHQMAKTAAEAGQDLLVAWSHATRPVGAEILKTHYYDFPE